MPIDYYEFLEQEMVPALGCTEPIAIAFAAAKCREVLALPPDQVCAITAQCSGNIIKNAKAVVVPNSGGEKGIESAVLLGMLGGRPEKQLEVLTDIDEADISRAKELKAAGLCQVMLVDGVAGLYIRIFMKAENGRSAAVTLRDGHTRIVRIEKDGQTIWAAQEGEGEAEDETPGFSFDAIYDFAKTCDLSRLEAVLQREIDCNLALAEEGLRGDWGVGLGRFVYDNAKSNKDYAIAYAAAGSDARMTGCQLPAVTNSGSGNQGLTVSLPVIKYAELEGLGREKMLRGLVFSNLMGEYQKQGIGKLSAYCGAVSAASAAVGAIAFMEDQPREIVQQTIINALATNSGIICDGAKSSCAGKIVSAINMAFMGYNQAKQGRSYRPGDGIVRDTFDETIRSIGRIARYGMSETDVTILREMLGTVKEDC